jgi:hypothetical protein
MLNEVLYRKNTQRWNAFLPKKPSAYQLLLMMQLIHAQYFILHSYKK